MPRILQGSIVRATVRDTNGGNLKTRPLVVMTKTSEILEQNSVVGVAITGAFGPTVKEDEVLLPWDPNGRGRTRLTKPCIAKCSWLRQLQQSDIIEVRGHLPLKELNIILEKIGIL